MQINVFSFVRIEIFGKNNIESFVDLLKPQKHITLGSSHSFSCGSTLCVIATCVHASLKEYVLSYLLLVQHNTRKNSYNHTSMPENASVIQTSLRIG